MALADSFTLRVNMPTHQSLALGIHSCHFYLMHDERLSQFDGNN